MLKDLILEKRKEKNMTQEQLADELGVARQTISKWELGETLPDIENLRKMALLFHFSIDKALGIEIEDDEDDSETFMLFGFIIGSALGVYFDNALLAFVCSMIGLGAHYIVKTIRKDRN